MKMNRGEPSRSCFYYWFIEPLKSQYKDDGSLNPAFTIPVKTNFGECELTLFLDSEGHPDFIRFKIPGFASEELKQEHAELLQKGKEHLLSILRLIYDPKTQVYPIHMRVFSEDIKPHFNVSIQELLGQRPSFPSVAVRDVFVGTWDKRTEIKLLTDALDERIPLQYRYLSLYKILENHFKKRREWQKTELKAFLSQFSAKFNEINSNLPLDKYIHALRDKCAHIKTGNDILGVTQLSQRQVAEVERFLPLFKNICITLLNSASNGKFTLKQLSEKPEWELVQGNDIS
jgi:hypothetical protein